MEPSIKDQIKKTMLFEPELCKKIEEMAEQNQRDFSKQVRFMLTEYIRMKENK